MKTIRTHRNFEKKYKKLPQNIQTKFAEKLKTFIENLQNPILRLHKLNGYIPNRYSINITGDYRAQFEIVDGDTYLFVDIGTHSELYS